MKCAEIKVQSWSHNCQRIVARPYDTFASINLDRWARVHVWPKFPLMFPLDVTLHVGNLLQSDFISSWEYISSVAVQSEKTHTHTPNGWWNENWILLLPFWVCSINWMIANWRESLLIDFAGQRTVDQTNRFISPAADLFRLSGIFV